MAMEEVVLTRRRGRKSVKQLSLPWNSWQEITSPLIASWMRYRGIGGVGCSMTNK